jgi:hypothetical protein
MYSLVYVSGRYVGAFVVILFSGLLSGIRFPESTGSRTLAGIGGGVLVLMVWVNIAAFNIEGLTSMLGFYPGLPTEAPVSATEGQADYGQDDHPAIADGLLRLGVERGDRVAFIGYSFSAFWARLARVRIIAGLEPRYEQDFWSDHEQQSAVLEAFGTAGAVAAVARATAVSPGWQRIGDTAYVVRFLGVTGTDAGARDTNRAQ